MRGVPPITGISFVLLTVMLKAASDTGSAILSETLMTIPVVVPTSSFSGVPLSSPVALLKLAHEGLF